MQTSLLFADLKQTGSSLTIGSFLPDLLIPYHYEMNTFTKKYLNVKTRNVSLANTESQNPINEVHRTYCRSQQMNLDKLGQGLCIKVFLGEQ